MKNTIYLVVEMMVLCFHVDTIRLVNNNSNQ